MIHVKMLPGHLGGLVFHNHTLMGQKEWTLVLETWVLRSPQVG